MSDLLDALLKAPTAPPLARRPTAQTVTDAVEVKNGNRAEVTVNREDLADLEGEARSILEEHGLDPAEWIVTGFRSSKWTMPGGEDGVSARYSFGRRGTVPEVADPLDVAELVERVRQHPAIFKKAAVVGGHTFIVALGDMQYGKIDGDGAEGTVQRAFTALRHAADLFKDLSQRFAFEAIHIAFLGDHGEGFVSQGGANVWRTPLTLSEQNRLSRQTMLFALEEFAPFGLPMTMVAVPGNHGDTVRFNGKGVTRYNDSHDTEALVAVSEAARMNPAAFGHVEFYVPGTDEVTVVLDLSGTRTGHVHGNQYRHGKHFEWWERQSFGGGTLDGADLLLAGHGHHLVHEQQGYKRPVELDQDGNPPPGAILTPDGMHELRARDFLQVPALESESTWWRHNKGQYGSPGLVVAVTKDGVTSPVEVVQ